VTAHPGRVGASRLTRRRFLSAAGAVTAASAAAVAIGCGDRTRPAGGTPAAAPTATPPAPVPKRGGILRVYNFDAQTPETFDPHVLRGGPIANLHSAVFSKLLRYEDEAAGTITPDLAAAMPEQPDELTYVFTLRDGVRFHDSAKARYLFPTAAGRRLVADDVRRSIERQLAGDEHLPSRFPRSNQLSVIERVTALDDLTLKLTLKAPVAPFIDFMANRHAFVAPAEVLEAFGGAVTSADALVGSGPFFVESFESGIAAKIRRNPAWFAADDRGDARGRPLLDGYDAFFSPQQDEFQRDAFDRGYVDSTEFLDPLAVQRARTTNLADIFVEEQDAGGLLASRLLIDRPPFIDDRARRAVHLAIDRRALAASLYPPLDDGSSARLAGPIAPALARWAMPESDLLKRPGYADDRAAAATEARQLWTAAMGDAPATELAVVFAGVPRTIPELAAPAVQRQVGEALGVNVVARTDPSGDALILAALRLNVEGAAEGTVAFTFGFEDGGVDLDDCLYGLFRGGEPGNTFRLQDATLDSMLDKQRAEFDVDLRRKMALDLQEYLLANVNARLEYVAPVRRRLSWGYVRNGHLPLWYGQDETLADTWLDASHPAWAGRKP
jgi:peptide/nickel transport system substrate-binding protein